MTMKKRNTRTQMKLTSALKDRCGLSGSSNYETPASLIRKSLLNFDLEITRVSSEMEMLDEKIKRNQFDKRNSAKRRAIVASNQYQADKQYLEEITKYRDDFLSEIDNILNDYEGVYKDIFKMAFITRGVTVEQIAEKTGYEPRKVSAIIATLREDLSRIIVKKRFY